MHRRLFCHLDTMLKYAHPSSSLTYTATIPPWISRRCCSGGPGSSSAIPHASLKDDEGHLTASRSHLTTASGSHVTASRNHVTASGSHVTESDEASMTTRHVEHRKSRRRVRRTEDRPPSSLGHDDIVRQVVRKMQRQGLDLSVAPSKSSTGEASVPEYLLSLGLAPNRVRDFCCLVPELLVMSRQRFEEVFRFLESLGLMVQQRVAVLATCPEILDAKECPMEHMEYVLDCLRSVQLGGNLLKTVVRRCPQVLLTPDPERFRVLVNSLASFFSAKDIKFLLYNHSPIIFSEFEALERRYEYIHFNMGIEPREIIMSSWYKRRLEFIQLRHECAARSGAYVHPHHKRPSIALANPKLAMLIDTAKGEFARRVAGISTEEYDAFKTLFMRQLDRDDDFDDDEEFDEGEEGEYSARETFLRKNG